MKKYNIFLCLLPMPALFAITLYFGSLMRQIGAALLRERLFTGQVVFQLLNKIGLAETSLIIMSAIVYITMVLFVIRSTAGAKK